MSRCENSLHTKRESHLVGRLGYNGSGLVTYFSVFIDAQGFKQFLRVAWEPFEAQFQSIEARFIHHTTIVVRLAGAEHHNYFYSTEAQDRQKQEGE